MNRPPVQPPSGTPIALPGDRAPALASSIVFAAVFSVFGVHGPYFPVWLSAQGLSSAQIAMTLGAPLVLRLLITPLLGRLADGRSDRRALVAALLMICCAAAAMVFRSTSFTAIFFAACVLMVSFQPIQPLIDANVGSLVRRGAVRDFGRIRSWGSISFAVVAVLVGFALNAWGTRAIVASYFGGLVAALLAVYWLPSAGDGGRRPVLAPLDLASRPALVLVMAAIGLIVSSQAMFFGFGSVQMLALGYPDWSIGVLWTVAVGAEVIVLWVAPAALRRLGPYRLLVVAAACTFVRWIGMGFDPPMAGTALLQLLHAGTLSCTYLATMAFVQQLVDDEMSARAQSAIVTTQGLMMAGMVILTGPLYAELGGRAYWAAAVLPLLALVLLLAGRRRLSATSPGPDV